MRNIRIILEYDGSDFAGWQKQPNQRTVQGELETAISALTGEEINIVGSGRTDSGVHARGQVANFRTGSSIPGDRFKYALNSILPEDIVVLDSGDIGLDFHSRYDAVCKKYRYLIYNSEVRPVLYRRNTYHVPYKLNFDLMKDGIGDFRGEHDFIGFMASNSKIKNTRRTIYDIGLVREGDLIYIDIIGNGFLYNMVRIISGTMVDLGRGKIKRSIRDIIQSKNRNFAGHTAPAQGLYLEWVKYSD